jgi:hypothetical protein
VTLRAPGPVTVLLAGPLAVGLVGCDATTYETSATTAAAVATTAYMPRGSTADLLASMATEVGALSERLVESSGQRAALARIEAQWDAARPAIEADRPELLGAFDRVIAQVRRSVERRRPADADKAAKSLAVLIRAYEG